MLSTFIFLVGLAGAGLLSYGAWLAYAPAGFIVGGVLSLMWSFLMARAGQSQPASADEDQ